MSEAPLLRVTLENDLELACLDVGQGTPMVCIHGWPQHSWCWRRLAARIESRCRVLAPDLRGFGDSSLAESGFDKKTFAADVASLVLSLGIESCVLVGHDWGGPIAYRAALDFPELVKGLVIMNGRMPLLASHNSLMFEPAHVAERWYFHFNRIPDLPEAVIGASLELFLSYFLNHWSARNDVFTERDLAELCRVYGRPGGLTAGLGMYRTALAADVRDWREHDGKRIEVPNLVLWGAQDPVLTTDYLEGLERVTPDIEIHVHDHAGHFLQEEAPDWCAERIVDFIARRIEGS